jgi:methylase of polypeptide subunit release factors
MPNNLDSIIGSDIAAAWYVLRPSEYTATLIQALLGMPRVVEGARALEIGFGSGVVLAALARLGAAGLCGVDCEDEAILAGAAMMRQVGAMAELHCGELWAPVAGRRFDLIVANLPHFPTDALQFSGRLPSWSHGGHDGRQLLNPFLEGLADHLARGGRAVITHNAFVDLSETRRRLAEHGLSAGILSSVLLALPQDKLAVMSPDIRAREEGHTIHTLGVYSFARMDILDISAAQAGD